MPNGFGLSLSEAVENWAVRTDDYTAKSLCDYIASKNTGYICRPHTHPELN